jgi:hypothetical protein
MGQRGLRVGGLRGVGVDAAPIEGRAIRGDKGRVARRAHGAEPNNRFIGKSRISRAPRRRLTRH